MPKVNVIMPAYNAERYVGEAVDSLLGQTFTDWKLIAVNDGSTDATPEILSSYGDSRIQVIHQDNCGEGCARNTALSAATGDYIGFLDADDLYLPGGLADLVSYLDSHSQYDVVYSDGIMCDQDRKPLMRLTEIRPGIYEGDILEQILLSSAVITVPVCTMVRRAAIEARRLRFDTRLVVATDSDFWIRLARTARFGYLDTTTCMYRVHETNVSRTTPSEAKRDARSLVRAKVLDSDWFRDLSLETRVRFLDDTLRGVLHGRPARQSETLASGSVLELPAAEQARLHRLVASRYLLRRHEVAFAERCLEQSLSLCPGDRKSQALLRLVRLSPTLSAAALVVWQAVHRTSELVRRLGHRRPRSVPAALRQ